MGLAAILGGGLILGVVVLSFWFSNGPDRPSDLGELRRSRADCRSQGLGFVWEAGWCWPAEPDRCQAVGGFWGLLGGESGEGCNRVAPDAGAGCRNGRECFSGQCLAVLTPLARQTLLAEPGRGVSTPGLCAGLMRVRGCNAAVTKGLAYRIVCRE